MSVDKCVIPKIFKAHTQAQKFVHGFQHINHC